MELERRQYLAKIVRFFRRTDKHIYKIRYPGGGKLQQLMSQWNEISSRMDVKTMLLDNALLELLHAKVRNPKLMELDLHVFDNLARNDPAGTIKP